MKAKEILNAVQSFRQHGYAVIPNFISAGMCQQAMDQINRLVDAFEPTPEEITIFGGQSSNSHKKSKYFLESASKVSFFFQQKAWENGMIKTTKRQSINKIGHSLHEHNEIFRDITYTKGVEQLCYELGINNPLVMQSMAILKPPKVGGKVSIHQDSTYLYAEPETLIGFWIPLQDATTKNGCLWGLPGSHKGKLYSRSKMVGGEQKEEIFYEKDFKQSDFIPLEMEKGSLAFFTGRFLHKSQDNTSNISRYAYTWHLMDQSSKWAPDNWLQRQNFPKFPLRLKK